MQGRDRDVDAENRHVDTGREEEGEMNWKYREACCAVVQGVAKNWAQLSD